MRKKFLILLWAFLLPLMAFSGIKVTISKNGDAIFAHIKEVKPLQITGIDTSQFPIVSATYTGAPSHTKNDVTVEVDGSSVDIKNFDTKLRGGEIINIYLVMDVSRSMTFDRSLYPEYSRMGYAQRSALAFLDKLPKNQQNKLIGYRIGILTFSDDVYENVALTDDYNLLKQAIIDLYDISSTSMYDGAYEALQKFKGLPGNNVVILFSDGEDNDSNYMQSDVVNLSKQLNIPIYTIALGNDADVANLQSLAAQTGGKFFKDNGKSSIDQSVLSQIFSEIAQRSKNASKVVFKVTPKGSGVTRNLKITVIKNQNSYIGHATFQEPIQKNITISSTQLSKDQQPQQQNTPYSITVNVVIDDIKKIKQNGVQVVVKNIQDSTWSNATKIPIALNQSKSSSNKYVYEATIPASLMQQPGIQYYAELIDMTGHTITSPKWNPQAHPYTVAVLPNKKPNIVLTNSITSAPQGKDITLEGFAEDTTNYLSSILIYYKNKNSASYDLVRIDDINATHKDFSLIIPASYVTSDKIFYFIIAKDNFGTETSLGSYNNPKSINIISLPPQNNSSQSKQSVTYTLYTGWNLLGAPFDINTQRLISQIENQTNKAISVRSIYTYDNANKKWIGWSKSYPSSSFTIPKNNGFWIFIEK